MGSAISISKNKSINKSIMDKAMEMPLVQFIQFCYFNELTTTELDLVNRLAEKIIKQGNPRLDDTLNGNTALILACLYNLPEIAHKIIETGQSNPGHVNSGRTALCICAKKFPDIALELIKTGQSKPGHICGINTALIIACSSYNSEVAIALIETGQSDPGYVNANNNTALIISCRAKLPEVALKLIKTGQSNPEHKSNENETALMWACSNKLTEVALELIKTNHSNPEQYDIDGSTALMYAIQTHQPEVALALIKTGKSNPGNIEKITPNNTALIYACAQSLSDVAIELIKTEQSNPTYQNTKGETALSFAEKNNLQTVVHHLLHTTTTTKQKQYKMPTLNRTLSPMSTAYDVVEGDVKIITYLLSDINNIAILLNNRWYLSNKLTIRKLIYSKDSVVFKCNSASGFLPPENIDSQIEYFRLNSIGLLQDYVPLKYIYSVLRGKHQYYMLEETQDVLPSVVSYNVYKNSGSWEGGSHCQEGRGGNVYVMRQTTINKPLTHQVKKDSRKFTSQIMTKEKENRGSAIKTRTSQTKKRTISSI